MAIERSAALHDPQCDTQWELPFSVASSYDWSEDDRVAWVRGLGVDERLTVVAAARNSSLAVGDKLHAMAFDPDRLIGLNKLAEARGRGDDVVAILQGMKPQDLQVALAGMPVATAPPAFSYEDASDPANAAQPFANGLIDGMLRMPLASAASK